METLRIKCPSCGIVLEVRNSKNEKVKKITCPNCQKQLAITFGDMAIPVGSLYEGSTRYQLNEGANAIPGIPSGLVELRVVRLKDGTPKHILRALTGEQKVKVNGQFLMQDDEIVLQKGDDLRIEGKSFSFDKPQANHQERFQEPETKPQPVPTMPKLKPKEERHTSKPSWLLWAAVALAIVLTIVFFWPANPPQNKEVVTKDSVISQPVDTPQTQERGKPKPTKAVTKTETTKDLSSLDLYSLELLANKNDVTAQYELGRRLVHASGSKNVVMGINWLHKASLNGSSEARQLKNKAVRTLQSKADHGDSVAYSILQLIDTH